MHKDENATPEASIHIGGADIRLLPDYFIDFVRELDSRQKIILSERLANPSPKTLEAIGIYVGLTRERVRQLEQNLIVRIEDLLSHSTDYWMNDAPMIGTIGSLLEKEPRLADSFNGINLLSVLIASQHASWLQSRKSGLSWLVFREDLLPKAEIPIESIKSIVQQASLESLPIETFMEWMALMRVSGEELAEFMSDFEIEFGREFLRSVPNNLADKLVATLRDFDRAMSDSEITEAISSRWTWGSARNLMSTDVRFMTVDISTYALSEWGLREYRGIKEEIISLIEDSGSMALSEVTAVISEWFPNVSELSVRTYSNSLPLQVIDGLVTINDIGVSIQHTLDEMTPKQLRGLFQCGDGFLLRIEVNADHLRGSGFPCSRAIGAILGIKIGESWSCLIEGYPFSLSIKNRATQSAFGTIRVITEALDAKSGDQMFFHFVGVEGRIDSVDVKLLRKTDVSTSPTEMVCQYMGITSTGSSPLCDVASYLGLHEGAGWSDVESTAAARGDSLLERAARLVTLQENQLVQ